ncbi:hypothetical protein DFH09DRAFT_1360491 [Mycena vulgaris]|nr:hypothetical protein DFH09DRAFT_1360491 [Mycena vulgaris]
MAQHPSLPPELEREILETAAQRHPSLMPTLLRVCHRVHTWIEPMLYKVLAIDNEHEGLLSIVESAIQSKPAGFLQTAVRHLFLWHLDPHRRARNKNVLPHCSGVRNLCIAGTFESDLLPALSNTHLQRLALNVPFSPALRLDHPLFLSVTHLDLYCGTPVVDEPWENWSHLAYLPALTHLCLSEHLATAIFPQVVGECPKLLVILVAIYGEVGSDSPDSFGNPSLLTLTDPREVITRVGDYVADWTAGARGGDDMWARADEFLARKRRGEIPITVLATCYFLDDHTLAAQG